MRRNPTYALALLAIVPLVVYVAAYFAMVEPVFMSKSSDVLPSYGAGGGAAAKIFYPIHQLDLRLRWSTWHPEIPLTHPPYDIFIDNDGIDRPEPFIDDSAP